MKNLSQRIAALSPQQRALLEEKMRTRVRTPSGHEIPLRRVPEHERVLSFAQQRLWFLDRLVPNNPAYSVRSVVLLDGHLNVTLFYNCLNEIIRRHEVLRTIFQIQNGQPRPVVLPHFQLSLPLIDIENSPHEEQEQLIQLLATQEMTRTFDLEHGPLIRVSLIQCHQHKHILLLTLHHIIADGWSIRVLFKEISEIYQSSQMQTPEALPLLTIQYSDFAAWQRTWLQGEILEQQLAYWQEQLSGAQTTVSLPTDRVRPGLQTFHGALFPFTISTVLTDRLRSLAQQAGATLFMLLFAIYMVLLHCYTNQDDIIIGSPIANRIRSEVEGLIGLFANMLALRVKLHGDPSFWELLARVRQSCLGAYAHQDVPIEKLIETLQIERNLQHQPLVQVVFVMQTTPRWTIGVPGLSIQKLDVDSGTSKFDLTLEVTEMDQGLSCTWEYYTDLFEQKTIVNLTANFNAVLQAILENPHITLATLHTNVEERLAQQHLQRREEIKQANQARLKMFKRRFVS